LKQQKKKQPKWGTKTMVDKKAIMLCLIILISSSVAAETGWLDLLDEQSKQFLLQDEEAVAAFSGTVMGNPLLVKDLQGGQDYYLVPFDKDGGTSGIIIIDASLGYFKQATWTAQPEKYLPVGKDELVEKIRPWLDQEPQGAVTMTFSYVANAELHWQAGPYTQSPFKPYWSVEIEGGQWIVDQQGNVYQQAPLASVKLNTTVEEVEGKIPATGSFKTMGKYYEIKNEELENGTFDVELTFSYPDEDQDGIVDGTEIDETKMEVYYFADQWIKIPVGERDTEANTITVRLNHFTMFALMEEIPPKPAEPPAQNPGGGAPLGGSPSGGGTTARLEIEVEAECLEEKAEVLVLNSFGNAAADAKVTVVKDNKVVEEKITDNEGKTFFEFEEPGEYKFIASKNLYTVNSTIAELEECQEEELLEPEEPEPQETEPEKQPEPQEPEEQEPEEKPEEPLGEIEQEKGQNVRGVGFVGLTQALAEQGGVTGLIAANQEPATNSVLAGVFAALVVGALLYFKKRMAK